MRLENYNEKVPPTFRKLKGYLMNFTVKELAGLIISIVIAFFVFGNISSKAGYPRWYGVLMAIPVLNIVVLLWFAYSAWPIENDLLKLQFRDGK